ncbi:MAG: hypothetical protein H0X46_08710, partial [Bacteroidetes bacterium]|nr:hypothetical protein [Bacteroidota bacterium]
MRKNSLLLTGIIFCSSVVHASSINVRILTTKVIHSFIFSPIVGSYDIYGDGKLLSNTEAAGIFQMNIEGDSVLLKTFERTIGKYGTLKMLAKQPNAAFKIKSVMPESKVRTYEDNLTVGLTADKKQFLLINKVDVEKYIGGV